MKRLPDPAPALTRGLALIRILGRDGQGALEQLAATGGWPKSSTLRYLQALQTAGVVSQDLSTRRWHLQERLVPYVSKPAEGLEMWRRRLAEIADAAGDCVELYEVDADRVELIERADPVLNDVRLVARVGFRRDLSECDSTALLWAAFSGAPFSGKGLEWRWEAGEKVSVSARTRRKWMTEARAATWAVDAEFNRNGIRRYSVALFHPGKVLAGILSIAQRQTPLAGRQHQALLERIQTLCTAKP